MSQSKRGRKPAPKKKPIPLTDMLRVEMNHKTWIYVKKGTTPERIEELRKKYNC